MRSASIVKVIVGKRYTKPLTVSQSSRSQAAQSVGQPLAPSRHPLAMESSDELLERAAERANIAHTIFMLMDSDADGVVAVEQVSCRPE